MAISARGSLDRFSSDPCSGFYWHENWSWQDPVSSAIYLKPCTHLDTLWFPRTMWRLSFAYCYVACILFWFFVSGSVWFPRAAQRVSVKGFSAFGSLVLNTLRQHIWCSHFLSHVCTWKPHGGRKLCVFSLRAECVLQPPGRTFFFAKINPMLSDRLDGMVPDRGAPPVACLRGHLEMWGLVLLFSCFVFFFIGNEHTFTQETKIH